MPDSTLKIWFLASRPKTLAAAVAPVALGAVLAYADSFLNPIILTLTFASAILIQIGTNYANDYYDFVKGTDTDHRTGPTRATQAGQVAPGQMKIAFILTFTLAALAGLFLVIHGGLPILIIGVVSLVCGVAYTAGPLPLGYLGLADLFVLIFFGPVAVGGTYYLQAGSINHIVIIAGFAPGLISTAILTVNNIRDIDTDRVANKKSLPVRFGRTFGIIEYIFCVTVACLIPIYMCVSTDSHYPALMSLFAMVYSVFIIRTLCANPSPEKMNSLLASTGKLLMIFTILFSIGWLL